jgi:ATP-binding cassette subfamily F protein 3
VIVAHDRHLLSAATDQWLLVADGKVQPFEGGLDDYREWARQYHSRGARGGEAGVEGGPTRREERRTEALRRQQEARVRKPFEERLAALDAELALLGREASEAEAWLAGAEAYDSAQRERLQETLRRRAELAARIATLEDDWLWAHARMDEEIGRLRQA